MQCHYDPSVFTTLWIHFEDTVLLIGTLSFYMDCANLYEFWAMVTYLLMEACSLIGTVCFLPILIQVIRVTGQAFMPKQELVFIWWRIGWPAMFLVGLVPGGCPSNEGFLWTYYERFSRYQPCTGLPRWAQGHMVALKAKIRKSRFLAFFDPLDLPKKLLAINHIKSSFSLL